MQGMWARRVAKSQTSILATEFRIQAKYLPVVISCCLQGKIGFYWHSCLPTIMNLGNNFEFYMIVCPVT